jgi:hypothetical protein
MYNTLGAVMAGLLLVTAVRAQEQPMPVRSFARFEFDTVTARGLWAEIATAVAHDDDGEVSANVITVEPRLVYGSRLFEAGLFIPHHWLHAQGFSLTQDENGIGDIRLYGKVIPLRSRWADAGLGFDVSFPSGDQNKGLGAGEVGLLPYGAASAHLGPVDVRMHLGYRAFTGSETDVFGNAFPPNSFVYGGGFFTALLNRVGLRAEFVGQSFNSRRAEDLLSFEPGIDVRWPFGAVDVFVRPTGAVGLTAAAPDWGVGGAVTVAWDPSRPR